MPEEAVKFALTRLVDRLNSIKPFAVAVSGGVDSMTLAYIAKKTVPGTLVFHALSPAVPESATQRVTDYSRQENWHLQLINAKEMQDPDYLKNPVNRCYFCKSNLYRTIRENTGMRILSGTNTDDLSDYRPGLIAAGENNVFHPYVEAGINKTMIRQLAKYFKLFDLQELPASPCLASRVSTGITINPEVLPLIDKTEIAVRDLLNDNTTVKAVRCRLLKDNIVIQLDMDDEINDNISHADSIREVVQNIFQHQNFEHFTDHVKIEPYKKGSAFIGSEINGSETNDSETKNRALIDSTFMNSVIKK